MPPRTSGGNIEFDVSFGKSARGRKAEPDTPFRILVLGDFSGRANRGIVQTGDALAQRRPAMVDVDNFEELMARLSVRVEIPLPGAETGRLCLKFEELDDFHPDSIFREVELFQALRQTRKRLGDPSTFASAAAEVMSWRHEQAGERFPGAEAPMTKSAGAAEESDDQTLGRLLGRPPTAKRASSPSTPSTSSTLGRPASAEREPMPAQGAPDINVILRSAVAPYIVPAADPRKEALIASVDEAITAQMSAILHHPDFQQLEAAWRGMHFLISSLETDDQLKIYLLDTSKAELAADLGSAESMERSGIYRLLVGQSIGTPGGEPWAVLVGLYRFHKTADDARLLSRLARIARSAGAPFIAEASPNVVGCESFASTPEPEDWQFRHDPQDAAAWDALRQIQEMSYVGLALPRFLLRLPYGRNTDSIDSFDFEEMPKERPHERYLWGNPSLLCACLLGQSFSQFGWDFRPGVLQEMAGLPVHSFETDGEPDMKPCAEAWLSDRAADRIAKEGLTPILSIKGRDAVQVFRFQSLRHPPVALSGSWRQ
jgi:type VI secretion system protein ImpC